MCPNCTDMRYLLLTALFALGFIAFAQAPDHVPAGGLVAWWPFDVDGQDLSGNGNHLVGHNGVQFVGQQGAFDGIYLDGVDDYLSCVPFNGIDGSSDHTLAFWTSGEIEYGNRWILTEYNAQANANKSLHCGIRTSYCSESEIGIASAVHDFYQNQSLSPCFSETTWNHWVMTFEREDNSRRIYKNGILIHEQIALPYQSNLNDGILVGAIKYEIWDSPDYSTSGFFDDVGIWNRPLLAGEVVALYESLATPGCTEEDACNYNPEALLADGSCDMVSCHCLEGTAWDESLGGCIPLISAETACGEGTVWDTEAQHCVIVTPSDSDFDGCVGMTDLLDLLSVFGTCNETPWSCGDPLEYQGYDYETVQIGEQCWFAENLQAERYRDGEELIKVNAPQEWLDYEGQGAMAVYESVSAVQGALYSLPVVLYDGGICPSGWKVPTDNDWADMESYLGMPQDEIFTFGYRGEAQFLGMQLKSTTGWPEGENGSDDWGFGGRPTGAINDDDGHHNEQEIVSRWWSSTPFANTMISRYLRSGEVGLRRLADGGTSLDGFSIRCIKDSE